MRSRPRALTNWTGSGVKGGSARASVRLPASPILPSPAHSCPTLPALPAMPQTFP